MAGVPPELLIWSLATLAGLGLSILALLEIRPSYLRAVRSRSEYAPTFRVMLIKDLAQQGTRLVVDVVCVLAAVVDYFVDLSDYPLKPVDSLTSVVVWLLVFLRIVMTINSFIEWYLSFVLRRGAREVATQLRSGLPK